MNIFAKILRNFQTFCLKNGGIKYVREICQNLNIFTKMVPFSHVADEFCFFCNKVKEKSTLANFRNIF
jgi:hypothetical protein